MVNFGPFSKRGWGGGQTKDSKIGWLFGPLSEGLETILVLIVSLHAKMPNGGETRSLKDLTYIGSSSVIVCNDCTMTQNNFTRIPANSLYLHFSWLRAMSLTSNILKFPATFKHFRWYLNVCQALQKNSWDCLFISKVPTLGICETRRDNSVLLFSGS